jgi:cell division protein FtsB
MFVPFIARNRRVRPVGRRAVTLFWLRRLALVTLAIFGVTYVPYRLYATSGLRRYVKLHYELAQLKTLNVQLRIDNMRLHNELSSLGVSPGSPELSKEAVEQAARDELGLVRPGEVVFHVPPEAR